MSLSEPIIFEPLFMERVWGGRRLETLFGKNLPPGSRIGESWEVVDREEAQSVVHNGTLRGCTLNELWTEHSASVFGSVSPTSDRFPLLFKLLDAQERLSVQVHPPAAIAPELGGEPKTEMWYVVDTSYDGEIFAGLKKASTLEEFDGALRKGHVEEVIHRLSVKNGETLFIPSGRIHAIGAGNVIVEVQQNSDTTYRVFDWNRVGLDGKPRTLHIKESLASIDFEDVMPSATAPVGEIVASCEYFHVEQWELSAPREAAPKGEFAIFTCLKGTIECAGLTVKAGTFFLIPSSLDDRELRPVGGDASVLRTTIPKL